VHASAFEQYSNCVFQLLHLISDVQTS
jgi:hypothetical protein